MSGFCKNILFSIVCFQTCFAFACQSASFEVKFVIGLEDDYVLARYQNGATDLIIRTNRGKAERYMDSFSYYDNQDNRNFPVDLFRIFLRNPGISLPVALYHYNINRLNSDNCFDNYVMCQYYFAKYYLYGSCEFGERYPFTFRYNPLTGKFDSCVLPSGSTVNQQDENILEEPLVLDNCQPEEIYSDSLIKFLRNDECVIYTGEGISSEKIPTMRDLFESICSFEGKCVLEATMKDPVRVWHIFDDFFDKCMNASPTDAHLLLHAILAFKPVMLLTENIDMLHEKTGDITIKKNEFTLKRDEIEQCFIKSHCMIVIGLSSDESGLINLYKQLNQKGKIVAINQSVPDYLSDNDFILRGKELEILRIAAEGIVSEC